MHSLKPVFDFPPGYPDFESIKKEADDILTSGHYIDVFHHGQAPIITDKLRRKIKD